MKNVLDFKEIGNRIQHYRTKNKLTQEKLGEMIGSDQKYISRIEYGYHNLGLNTIVAIAKALNVSVDCLVADYNDGTDENNLHMILNEIRGMNKKQLAMLRDHITIIKKYDIQ
ncbi:MAG: helix-turn-helix transcriptional regulator [Clostridia bacterium]|nr:helix-turn-helix transcriptional regulator [Clostridia bacterium]